MFEQVQGEFYLVAKKRETVGNQTVMVVQQQRDFLSCKKSGTVTYTPLLESKINWNLCSEKPNVDKPLPYTSDDLTEAQVAENKKEWLRRIAPPPPINKTKLWGFVKQYLYHHMELPDERLYDVLTAWVFATWVPELWNTAPYVFFLGPKSSGKTRSLSVLQSICFRGKISISTTPPALFRSIEKYGVVPFLDEAEVYNQDNKLDVIACLNAGYKRESGNVERFQGDVEHGDVVTFHVFGFKGIAGTEALKSTLESRSVVVRMAKNTRDLAVTLNADMATLIRNGLLRWRFETLLDSKPAVQKQELKSASFEDFGSFEEFYAATRPCLDLPPEFLVMRNSRVVELFLPLYLVSDGAARDVVVDYAKTVHGEQRTEENTSTEAEVLLALLDCCDLVECGIVPNSVVEAAYNRERPVKEQLWGKSLTGKVAAMGFTRGRTRKGMRGFVWDTKKLTRLCERYGFNPENYDLTPTEPKQATLATSQRTIQSVGPVMTDINSGVCPNCKLGDVPLEFEVTYTDGATIQVCALCGGAIYETEQNKP